MSILRSFLPVVARSNGWRCFSTGVPSDMIAELNKVRHLNIYFGYFHFVQLFLLVSLITKYETCHVHWHILLET
jgi:cyclic pyranopterin phosphate synthase